MKKILFATTALVASTTFAMADVEVSGEAEMGIFGGGGDSDIEDQFHTDVDVIFSMAGSTDTGLTFGAEVELSDGIGIGGSAVDDDSDDGEITIFVSGALGTLTMGDTDGALDFVLQEAIIGGTLRDDHEHAGYNGNAGLDGIWDGQVARYDYELGSIALSASAELEDGGDGDPALGIGGRYTGEFGATSFGAGLGFQRVSEDDLGPEITVWGASLDFQMDNGFQGIVNYSNLDVDDSSDDGYDHFGIAGGYEFGQLLIAANYGVYDFDNGDEQSGIGLVANYDLGGGAELQAGYAYNDFESDVSGDSDFNTYSLGIAMSF